MNELCYSTDLTSSEMASWIQAIGSMLAIAIGFLVAVLQSKSQHNSAIKILKEEHRLAKLDVAETLLVIANASNNLTKHYCEMTHESSRLKKLRDREEYFDTNDIRWLETSLLNIPLHTLPHELVHHVIIFTSLVRHFSRNINLLEETKFMETPSHHIYVEATKGIKVGIEKSCKEISAEIEKLKNA